MAPALLAVKFFIPKPRPGLTERARLFERFSAGTELPLTLVSAPAGFGKSTLLAAWAGSASPNGVLAWLAMDAADNRPSRFWTYLMAAIETRVKNRGMPGGSPPGLSLGGLLEFLQSDPPPAIQPVLDEFINAVAGYPEPIFLVLDDYHEIHSAQIHEQVAYLLDHQPPNLHLVISTRVDPPLPITRLRARGLVSEFRAADLRFTADETADFFEAATRVQVTTEDIAAIQKSTEGWIAGLQMAALALAAQSGRGQDREQVHAFIQSFSGKNTYVLDYLVDEVFNRQPEMVQRFLLQTSVLERMCASLCDAILDDRESINGEPATGNWATGQRRPPVDQLPDRPGPIFTSSQSILEYLDRSNLFLVPLDSERQWFRYHHLFADLLRVRLDQVSPGLKHELQGRASAWYEQNGSMEQAIQYAVLAQDWDRAAELMEREIQSFLERGQLSRVMEWAALLPKEVSSRRVELLFQQAYVMGLAHRMKEFVPLLEAEEQAVAELERDPGAPPEQVRRLRCNLNFQKGYLLISKHDPLQARQLALEGIRILPPNCPLEESWLYWLHAYADRSLNRLPQAVDGFQEAFRVTQAHGNLWTDMVCLTDLAMVYHLLGDLQQACDVYRRALELGKKRGAAAHSYLTRVEGWLSLVLIERNELASAEEHARAGLELSEYWPSTNTRSVVCIALAQLAQARDDLERAGEWLERAGAERNKSPLMPVNDSLLDYNLVRYWLARGDLAAAAQWAQPFRVSWKSQEPDAALSETTESQGMALARVLIAQGATGGGPELEEAVGLLDRIERSARASGRVNSLVEAGVLKAAALQTIAMNQPGAGQFDPAALGALEASLAAGEPGGYVRVYLDEGNLMAQMLAALRARYDPAHPPACSKPYLDRLLGLFPTAEPAASPASAPGLPEALTERELEVLQLMASGLSNREMAARLVLSEGTIKSHVHNLIGKLGAQSRTHALALAREHNLL